MNCHSILTYFFLFLYIQWGFNYCPFDIKKNEINDFLYLADQILFKRVVNVCVQLLFILLMLVCISFGPLKLNFFFFFFFWLFPSYWYSPISIFNSLHHFPRSCYPSYWNFTAYDFAYFLLYCLCFPSRLKS